MDASSGLAQVLSQLATDAADLPLALKMGVVNGLKDQFAAEFNYWPNFYDRLSSMSFVGVTMSQAHRLNGYVAPLNDKDRFASVGNLSRIPYRDPESPESDVELKDSLLLARRGFWVHHKTAWNGEPEKTAEFRHTFEPLNDELLMHLLDANDRLVEQVVTWFTISLKKAKERAVERLKKLEAGASLTETVVAVLNM